MCRMRPTMTEFPKVETRTRGTCCLPDRLDVIGSSAVRGNLERGRRGGPAGTLRPFVN